MKPHCIECKKPIKDDGEVICDTCDARITAEQTAASKPMTGRFGDDLSERLPDAFTNAIGTLEHLGREGVAEHLQAVAKTWFNELKALRAASPALPSLDERGAAKIGFTLQTATGYERLMALMDGHLHWCLDNNGQRTYEEGVEMKRADLARRLDALLTTPAVTSSKEDSPAGETVDKAKVRDCIISLIEECNQDYERWLLDGRPTDEDTEAMENVRNHRIISLYVIAKQLDIDVSWRGAKGQEKLNKMPF